MRTILKLALRGEHPQLAQQLRLPTVLLTTIRGVFMWDRWAEVPFAALTMSLAAGITASSLLAQYWFSGLALAAAALAGAAGLSLARNRAALCMGLSLLAVMLGGLLLGLAERDGYCRDDVRALVACRALPLGEQILLDGCVLEDSQRHGPDTVITLALRGFRRKDAWIRCRGTLQLRVAVPVDEGVPEVKLEYGDRVRVWAECDLPRNFMNPGSPDRVGLLARRGIHLLARTRSPRLFEVLRHDFGTPWGRSVASVRRSLHDRISRLRQEGYPQRAAVLSSIVLGDYLDLSTDTRTDFQNAGTYHVLVVSGMHVSTIAWILIHLLRALRMPATGSRLLTALGIFFFTCLVGFQASMTRALWMFILYLIGQSLFRRASPTNTVLACAFLLLAAHPGWLRDAGFQLSFLSVTSIVLMALPAMERLLHPLLHPLRHAGNAERLTLRAGGWDRMGRRLRFRAELVAEGCEDCLCTGAERILLAFFRCAAGLSFILGSMLLISFSVQAWLNPVLAFYFNRLSWIAPAANLAVVPLSSVVLAAGMAAEVLTAVLPSAWPAFRLAGGCSALLLGINRWFAALPGAWQRCPTPPGSWVIAGLVLLFFWCLLRWRRLWIPCAFVGLEIATLSLAELRILSHPGIGSISSACGTGGTADSPRLHLSFLDVGQGDAIVIQFPDGRTWAVDAGGLRTDTSRLEDASPFDVGEAVVSRFLWSRWIVSLDRVVLTHPHQDHAGGMPAVLRNFTTRRLDFGNAGADPAQASILETARKLQVQTHEAEIGEEYLLAGVTAEVLNPGRVPSASLLNDKSVVLHLRYGRFSALLAGDLEGTGEAPILAGGRELYGQLLKVPHHGSRNATSDRLLDRVRPRWAVISVGRKNPFQNPAHETLQRLVRHEARILLTMEEGAIFFHTDGMNYCLSSFRSGVLDQGVLSPEGVAAGEKRMPMYP